MFENAFSGQSLAQVLGNGGGGLSDLGRQTVAALLNADAFYPGTFSMSRAQVIAAFNAVYPGTKDQYTALANQFEGMTDAVAGITCPLNGGTFQQNH